MTGFLASRRVWLPACAALAVLVGCEAFHSDSENFANQQRAERKRRVAGMRAATQQQPAGTYLSGDTLATTVSGRTHVFVYGTTPGGRAERYVEYSYFRADGRYVYQNTEWAKDPDGRDGDHWRVDGERLCLMSGDFGSDEHCYRLAVLANGRIQYFIDAPGSETHGLLTKVTDAIRDGQPRVDAWPPAG